MKNIFGPAMVCVYLDQFAASNILDQPADELWEKITALLIEKVKAGKVICPVPPEHFFESSNKEKENALKMDEAFYQIAKGFTFLPEAFVAAKVIIALLRGTATTRDTYFAPLVHPDTLSQPAAFEKYKASHDTLNKQVTQGAAGQNEMRKLTRVKRFPDSAIAPLTKVIKQMEVNSFTDRLQDLIRDGFIINRGVETATGPVVHWIDLVIEILLKHHDMTFDEMVFLRDVMVKTGFDKISTLDIRLMLTANLAGQHKKESVNDQIDIMRLSTGLPPSDLLFTDRQRKFELQQTGLDKKYGTAIFSGTKPDLTLFYEQLQLI
jgi:hypothetical protein